MMFKILNMCTSFIFSSAMFTYLTNQMEQNPSSEASSHSGSQEIPCFLWNPMVNHCVHKNPPLATILSHMHPVHTFPPYFPMIHSNIIHLCVVLPSGLFPSGFPANILYGFPHLTHACYMTHPFHPPRFDHPNNIL
jgi:hypothetical protein